jgi:hypothetical protein
MKKFIQVSLVVVVVFSLVLGFFQLYPSSTNVGWNSGISALPAQNSQQSPQEAFIGPVFHLDVGWNS